MKLNLILAAALIAACQPTLAACDWNHPGRNPYTGSIADAINSYTHIPAAVRGRLLLRADARQWDEVVTIERDRIRGVGDFGPALRSMHFGDGVLQPAGRSRAKRVCDAPTRSGWKADHTETAAVICESGHCIAIPFVCRNVALVTRNPDRRERELEPDSDRRQADGPASGEAMGPLDLAPTGAGLLGDGPTFLGQSADPAGAAAQIAPYHAPLTFYGLGGAILPLPAAFPPPLSPVPEPVTWLMYLAGLAGIAVWRRRR